ncbi:Ribosomal protein L27 L41 mitochondrial [Echinococcus multilocularis]|uniref:Ribosomal protein L27 L41 mitochondrial n=1 Tax=Echinococcus multilocularis TaxID=6211 RepID=A0A068YJ76_ECHMU|nr:Ribosomal protein L27 L41 mitochondrial [Echinococcus multilocularis]
MAIKLCLVGHLCRGISTSLVLSRQKIAYVQRYKWLLDVCKSRRRARYPWIPREPPTSCVVNGEIQEMPEMRVEFVVPENLDRCELKPYVSWQAANPFLKYVIQTRFDNFIKLEVVRRRLSQSYDIPFLLNSCMYSLKSLDKIDKQIFISTSLLYVLHI